MLLYRNPNSDEVLKIENRFARGRFLGCTRFYGCGNISDSEKPETDNYVGQKITKNKFLPRSGCTWIYTVGG